jgi:DNA modification methylase
MLNSLILGDNLEVLKSLPDNSVDLCYIDPPFFSNRNYAVIWGDKGEVRSFEDCWDGGVDTYINWMYKRVEQIHRILKPTGSFYLHCDWHADAYLRVYVLDKIFGAKNFRNEVIWKYKTRVSSKKYWNRRHDNIFFYSKTDSYIFNWDKVTIPLSENTIKKYRLQDENGRYRLNGRGITGSPIRSAKDVDPKWEISNPELVVRDYLRDGQAPEDLFELDIINQNSQERIGYPTQKPEALLERIIKASSNEGDTVLDCFMGGGTTIAVAQKLGRNWIGIDQSPAAFGVTRARLDILTDQGVFGKIPFEVRTQKYDYDEVRNSDAFEFEKWIVEKFGGKNNEKQRGDFGLDGVLKAGNVPNLQGDLMPQDEVWQVEDFDIVIQVKRSDAIGRNPIDNLKSAMERFNKNLKHAYLIAFSFGSGAKQEVARLKREQDIEIRLVEVSKIIPLSTRPKIKLVVKENKEAGYWEFVIEKKDKSEIEFYTLQIFEKTKTGTFETKIFENFLKENNYNQALKKGEYKIVATATDEFGLVGREEVSVVVG